MSDEKVHAPDEPLKIKCQGSDNSKGAAFSIERLLAPCEKKCMDEKVIIQDNVQLLRSYTNYVQSTTQCKQFEHFNNYYCLYF